LKNYYADPLLSEQKFTILPELFSKAAQEVIITFPERLTFCRARLLAYDIQYPDINYKGPNAAEKALCEHYERICAEARVIPYVKLQPQYESEDQTFLSGTPEFVTLSPRERQIAEKAKSLPRNIPHQIEVSVTEGCEAFRMSFLPTKMEDGYTLDEVMLMSFSGTVLEVKREDTPIIQVITTEVAVYKDWVAGLRKKYKKR